MNDINKEYLKALDSLTEALGISEEIVEELCEEGMDVDAILSRLKEARKNISSLALKRKTIDSDEEKSFKN